MPANSSYDYAIIRIVPSIERGECFNVGVILFCRTRRFLGAQVYLDRARLQLLAPDLDIAALECQLEHLLKVCHGQKGSGPIGELSPSERFHWLVSPRSTIIQTSPVHSGLSNDPVKALAMLVDKLVMLPTPTARRS